MNLKLGYNFANRSGTVPMPPPTSTTKLSLGSSSQSKARASGISKNILKYEFSEVTIGEEMRRLHLLQALHCHAKSMQHVRVLRIVVVLPEHLVGAKCRAECRFVRLARENSVFVGQPVVNIRCRLDPFVSSFYYYLFIRK